MERRQLSGQADCEDWLSRMPSSKDSDLFNDDNIDIDYCYFLSKNTDFYLNFEILQKETASDKILKKVIYFIKKGWPKKVNDISLKAYFAKRFEFDVIQNCIIWNHRIVIPSSMRQQVLQELHKSQMGAVKMKSLARGYVWFPNLDVEIENLTKKCDACVLHSNNAPKSQISPWPWPKAPWERIHIDFFDFRRKNYLVILDAYSKWLEVFEMSSITSTLTIQALRRVFATFGLPITLVSDNGRQLVSDEFENFLAKNNVKHVTSPPYSPASNGAAENAVKTVKSALKKALVSNSENTNVVLCRFLLDYRVTPHCTTGVSPAILMLGRNLRTRLSNLLPTDNTLVFKENIDRNVLSKRVEHAQSNQIKNSKPNKEVNFDVNETVLVKNYKYVDKPTFIRVITKKLGIRTYLVKIPELEKLWKRHTNQLKKYTLHFNESKIPTQINSSVCTNQPNLEISPKFNVQSVNIDNGVNNNRVELENKLSEEQPECSSINNDSNSLKKNEIVFPENKRPRRIIKPVIRFGSEQNS